MEIKLIRPAELRPGMIYRRSSYHQQKLCLDVQLGTDPSEFVYVLYLGADGRIAGWEMLAVIELEVIV